MALRIYANQTALEGAFSVIVQRSRTFVSSLSVECRSSVASFASLTAGSAAQISTFEYQTHTAAAAAQLAAPAPPPTNCYGEKGGSKIGSHS